MMENKVMREMMEKAKSAEELLALARENGIVLTEDQAISAFNALHNTGELADDELDNVAGGVGCQYGVPCPKCGGTMWGTQGNPFICDVCGNQDLGRD